MIFKGLSDIYKTYTIRQYFQMYLLESQLYLPNVSIIYNYTQIHRNQSKLVELFFCLSLPL